MAAAATLIFDELRRFFNIRPILTKFYAIVANGT